LVAAKQSLELVTTGIGAAGANIDEKHHRHPISAAPDLRADCVKLAVLSGCCRRATWVVEAL